MPHIKKAFFRTETEDPDGLDVAPVLLETDSEPQERGMATKLENTY